MDDLEIKKLCAEAMKIPIEQGQFSEGPYLRDEHQMGLRIRYDPLHDDAQAMALVKRFGLCIYRLYDHGGSWIADMQNNCEAQHPTDLNRAICECVAKIQLRKESR